MPMACGSTFEGSNDEPTTEIPAQMPDFHPSCRFYALAIFGLMAAIVAALWVREMPVALAPRAIEAAAGD
jgi:hypothetical protein